MPYGSTTCAASSRRERCNWVRNVRAADGRAVLVRGGEFVIVSPHSRLRIAAEDRRSFVQIIQDVGRVVFQIERKATPHFSVQTPYLAALVKGTTFSVTVGPEGGTVTVKEGRVEVSTLDGAIRRDVDPGMMA